MSETPTEPDPVTAKLLTPADLVNWFQLSLSWVYEKSRARELPGTQLGGENGPWRYDPIEVQEYLDACHNQRRKSPRSRPRGAKRTLRHLDADRLRKKWQQRETPPDPPDEAGQ